MSMKLVRVPSAIMAEAAEAGEVVMVAGEVSAASHAGNIDPGVTGVTRRPELDSSGPSLLEEAAMRRR
jgi:hypothetical protein